VGNVSVVNDPQLTEVEYGRWQGMVYDELIDDPDYVRYREHPLETPTPGGESMMQVQSRGVEAVNRAILANPRRRILFVSHGDIIRTVLCHYLKIELALFRRIRIDNPTFPPLQIIGDFAEIKFLNLLSDPERPSPPPFMSKKQTIPQPP